MEFDIQKYLSEMREENLVAINALRTGTTTGVSDLTKKVEEGFERVAIERRALSQVFNDHALANERANNAFDKRLLIIEKSASAVLWTIGAVFVGFVGFCFSYLPEFIRSHVSK
jgi:hypothetical protein